MRAFWFTLGCLSIALGAIGAVLPLLPTVPFLLLAAISFSKSSPRVHDWLIAHPRLGKPIEDWRRGGAIGPRAKKMASVSILAAFGISLALGVAPWALALQAAALCCVAVFIWTRPDHPPVLDPQAEQALAEQAAAQQPLAAPGPAEG
ncbi:YbaN family protein [Rhodovulum sp. DZ06]|uniref:YbaN family protein n=1 Tax=Rhodovulum sp. DZ06 TaxID=3425126 RepID=UPI003D352834